MRLHPLRPFVLQLWNETLLSFPPWPAAVVLPATRAAEHGRPAVSSWTASPPEREDVRAAPGDPSPKRRKQRRGCRQDAPRPSEGIFPCSIESSARRNFPLLSRSSANRARQNRGAYKYTCRRFKISLSMSEPRERALKSILRARREAAEE